MYKTLALAVALAAPAAAQSSIFGVNVRLNDFFESDTANFVANYVESADITEPIFGLDFDATATTLYGIDNDTLDIVTFDLVTGTLSVTGTIATLPGITGLTADPNGTDWWATDYDAAVPASNLYRGDITTGVFTLVGTVNAGIVIDIAMDSQGNLYAHDIVDDSLYSVDTATGAGTLIGATGLNANFAQGMDFDWSNDTLYATIYTGGGTGQFCTIDLTTGLATQLEDTVSLNAEMEMAVQQPVGGTTIGTPFCNANPNSTGVPGVASAVGSTSTAANDVTLQVSSVPPQQFGIFVVSDQSNAGVLVGSGILCLTGGIGRYQNASQIWQANGSGEASLVIDLTAIPRPSTTEMTMPGDTWQFQAWHRDVDGSGAPTSNFTAGVSITFN